MRPEENPLDLNNLPEEYGKQALEESSTTTAASTETTSTEGFKKKKSGGKDESGKVYECRFCSLKFCKSQALGGHMNRHRQERETETLNRARQLVYGNEGGAGAGVHIGLRDIHIGGGVQSGNYQSRGGIGEQFRPVYPRLSTQSPPPAPPPFHPYICHPSSSTHPLPYPASFPTSHPPMGEYFIGHVLSGSSPRQTLSPNYDSSYTCFGAPLGFSTGPRMPGNQSEGLNWSCSHGHGQHSDPSPSSVDRR